MKGFSHIREIIALNGGDFEQVCKQNVSSVYLGNNTVLCKVLSKHKLYVDPEDLGVVPHLILDGYWETWVTQCMAKIVQPGDVCIDLGANFGYFTLLMSELSGPSGRTIAVEPNSRICQYLRMSQNVNAFPFEIAEVAVSDKKGITRLNIPQAHPGSGTIIPLNFLKEKSTRLKVRMATVDELVVSYNLPKVDIIKMDVEGVEPLVFKGMQNTISKNPEIKIIMEYSPFLYKDAKGFTEFLFQNFIVHRIKDVPEMIMLDESSIDTLVQLTDHTDLYLQRK